MNTIELFQDPAQAEASQISAQAPAPCLGLATSGTVLRLGPQNRKGVGCDPLKHTAAFDFFGHGRDQTFTVKLHMDIFFGKIDDLCDMQRSFCCKEYVISDAHLGPTSCGWRRGRPLSLSEELADGFQL